MWLFLCSQQDVPALWTYRGLQARGLSPLELVSPEVLACSRKWEHRLGSDGGRLRVTLADGRTLQHDRIRGVLNRLPAVPSDSLAASPDRDYAVQELTAFFLSWLHALPCPVFNLPTPQGLCGAWRHPSEWAFLAAKAGLRVSSYHRSRQGWQTQEAEGSPCLPPGVSCRSVLVFNGEVDDRQVEMPLGARRGCRRLAKLCATPLLGIDFAVDLPAAPWTFLSATPIPDLRLGGETFLDRLAGVFQQGKEAVG